MTQAAQIILSKLQMAIRGALAMTVSPFEAAGALLWRTSARTRAVDGSWLGVVAGRELRQ
jgi:hypothetical protein